MISKSNLFCLWMLNSIVTDTDNTLRITKERNFLHVDWINAYSLWIHIIYEIQAVTAIYSDSSVDMETLVFFLDCQLTCISLRNWHHMVVLCRSNWHPPKLASKYVWLKNLVLPGYQISSVCVRLRFWKMLFTAWIYGSRGFYRYQAQYQKANLIWCLLEVKNIEELIMLR